MKVNSHKINMSSGTFRYILILLFVLFGYSSTIFTQTSPDSIIMGAMRDELTRNFNGLHAENFDKPFFISYTIADAVNTQVIATLGALIHSDEIKYKDWQVRLMVGNYEINDENFSSNQPEESIYRPTIDMPLENDYQGIRRSLWLTTNNVYYSAAQTYKNKIAQIEHRQLKEEDLEIDDFSKAPVIRKYICDTLPVVQKETIEQKVKYLSEIFKNSPELYSSSVSMNAFRSTVYFINSEGTEIQFPFHVTTLSITTAILSNEGERINKNIIYTVSTPFELPAIETIEHDISILLDNLSALKNSERFKDNYYGPVLLAGEVAAETLEKFLFAGSDALIAERENLQSSNQMNMFYEQTDNSFQTRIGKSIFTKDLTIISEPFLREYRGIPLLGSYKVDAEGVIPSEKLILVKNGILETLLNGRTPSRFVPESNGHMRFSYNYNGVNKQVGPGVIRIENANPVPFKKLKEQLLEQAKAEGLDYAIMIKSIETGGSDKPFNFYLVSVETGEEKLVRSVQLKNLTMQSLRHSPVFSDSVIVHNTLLSTNENNNTGLAGIPASFIVPYAMLLREIEFEGTHKPLTSMLPVVENPVGRSENTISSSKEENIQQ
jgi:hypothetical protein